MNGSPIICPRCGQSNREQARFCIQCGHALAAQPAATASPRSRSWRGLLIGLLALVVVVGLGAAAVWWLKRPPELPAASQATPDGQSTEPGISPTGVSPTTHPPGEAAVSQPATLEATDALEEAEPSRAASSAAPGRHQCSERGAVTATSPPGQRLNHRRSSLFIRRPPAGRGYNGGHLRLQCRHTGRGPRP
ncbi:MAG: zinc-ribbon domain-containing protein [Candidatus Promineofilum sp.]|nr:zinc-ribbon domain-containing protein [Promineifilum sp.]